MRWFASILAVFALALVTVRTPCAHAGVREVLRLGEGETALTYSVGGANHLALIDGRNFTQRLALSNDDGKTFTDVPPDPRLARMLGGAVDADGRRWLAAMTTVFPAAIEISTSPAGGSPSTVATFPGDAGVAGPASAFGARYIAVRLAEAGAHTVIRRVSTAGVEAGGVDLGDIGNAAGELFADHRGLWLRAGSQAWLMSSDGSVQHRPYTPDVGLLGAGLTMFGGQVFRPVSAEVWRGVPDLAGSIRRLTPIAGGTLAQFYDRFAIVDGVDDYPSRGPLEADTAALIGTANEIRGQQGLPALIADPAVSVASRNHALFQSRWQLGNAHREDMSLPGATGLTPSDRCAAVGAVCGAEIVAGGASASDAVWGWWTTPLHRLIVAEPDRVAAGGALAAATAVMNDAPGIALTVAPVGLPRGTWPGPVEFGGETPDPGAPCGLKAPYGLAQTAYSYLDPGTGTFWWPGQIALTDVTAGQPVIGCSPVQSAGGAYNVPAAALIPGHAYAASTVYTSQHGEQRPFTWTFQVTPGARTSTFGARRTSPDGPAGTDTAARPTGPCLRVTAAARARARTIRAGLTVKVRSCRSAAGQVQVRVARKVRARKALKLRANRTVAVKVKARVSAGTITLVAIAGKDMSSRRVRVRR